MISRVLITWDVRVKLPSKIGRTLLAILLHEEEVWYVWVESLDYKFCSRCCFWIESFLVWTKKKAVILLLKVMAMGIQKFVQYWVLGVLNNRTKIWSCLIDFIFWCSMEGVCMGSYCWCFWWRNDASNRHHKDADSKSSYSKCKPSITANHYIVVMPFSWHQIGNSIMLSFWLCYESVQ